MAKNRVAAPRSKSIALQFLFNSMFMFTIVKSICYNYI